MTKPPRADDTGGTEFAAPVEIELPYLIATLLPDGNLDLRIEGKIPVDKMFTISALVSRVANKALDDEADAQARRRSLIIDHRNGKGK